ncbi:hemagglutinin repeat-containing protein [Neisseriaceae bacterium JH1-16]|nr:hemagglutinin repeat-containing protein [Neisseriaceae bacterium JH1-16]
MAGGGIKLVSTGSGNVMGDAKPIDGDLTINGSNVKAGGTVSMAAARDVDISASTSTSQTSASNYDYSTRVSSYAAQAGDLTRAMQGGPNNAGTSLMPYNQARSDGQAGSQSSLQQGSQISGKQVQIYSQAGNIDVLGSSISGTQGVTLVAKQGDITVGSGTNKQTGYQTHAGLTIGNLGGGNNTATIGVQHTKDSSNDSSNAQSTFHSQIVSQGGDVTLSANNNLQLSGADLVAGNDLTLKAKSIQIDPGVDLDTHTETHSMNQWGVTATAGSPILSAVQTSIDMAKSVQKTGDGRTQALAAATSALAAYNAYQAAQSAASGTLASGSVTIGATNSQSSTTSQALTTSGSSLAAGHDLTIIASGAGQNSYINISGSSLQAGHDLSLMADNQINLGAAQDSSSLQSKNSGSGWGVGVAASVGSNGVGFGITVNASTSKGHATGNGTQQQYTNVDAGNTLTLKSGGDTTLKGASASGKQIIADVGGNLDIESLQDTSQYDSKQMSASGSVTIGFGASASGSYNQQSMKSDYASVTQQAGLKAGGGGFQINVAGNTNLTGAVIESSQAAIDAGKNSLTTGTLTVSDIRNHAEYSGESIGLSGGFSMGSSGTKDSDAKGSDAGNASTGKSGATSANAGAGQGFGVSTQAFGNGVNPGAPIVMSASGKDSSTTISGISGGTLTITNSAAQQAKTGQTAEQAAASVNRDVSTGKDTTNALTNNFDKEQLQTTFEVTAAFAQQMGTFMASKAAEGKSAQEELKKANDQGMDPNSSAYQQLVEAAKWAPGGAYSQIVTALTAGVTGNVSGGLSGLVRDAAVAYLQGLGARQVKDLADKITDPTVRETTRAALQAVVGCAGASTSAQSCGAGAAGAAASVAVNNLLDWATSTTAQDLNADEKLNRRNLVDSLIAGIAMVSGSSGVTITVNAAQTELENNSLKGVVLAKQAQLPPSKTKQLITDSLACTGLSQSACQRSLSAVMQAYDQAIDPKEKAALLQTMEWLKGVSGMGQPAGVLDYALMLVSDGVIPSRLLGKVKELLSIGKLDDAKALVQDAVANGAASKGAKENISVDLSEVKGALAQQITDLRATLSSAPRRSGNMGVAQIDIPGVQPTMAASSQVNSPTAAQQALGFVGQVIETFPSSIVPSKSGVMINRASDSEAKILNNIAAQLGDRTSTSGTINLLTEKAPCESCADVIKRFEAKYPNIKVNVMDNGGAMLRPPRKGS